MANFDIDWSKNPNSVTPKIFVEKSLVPISRIETMLLDGFIHTMGKDILDIKRIEEYKLIISRIAIYLTTPQKFKGLLLWGNVGSGKTIMLKVIHKFLCDYTTWANSGRKFDFIFLSSHDLCKHLIGKHPLNIESIYKLKTLFIDDIGAEDLKYFDTMPMAVFIENVDTKKITTILATTNCNSKLFNESYGLRVADKIKEMFYCIKFPDESFRENQKIK